MSFLDLLKVQHSYVPDSVISWFTHKWVHLCSYIYLCYQYNHWFSCLDDHNILWSNSGPSYYFDFLLFFLWGFGPWQDRLGCWCLCQVGWWVQALIYWIHWWWQGMSRTEKLSMFLPLHNSCDNLWTSGFHSVSVGSFWIVHRDPLYWGLDHYHLACLFLIHLHWGIMVWCGDSRLY